MSRVDELPADQRAALSLLLRQRKSYADLAGMLNIQERAVHDRAQAALAVLAPRQARELDAEHRQEIGDYMLGQQDTVGERLRTRTLLSDSPAANTWANALAVELLELADGALPEIPVSAAAAGASPGGTHDQPAAPPQAPADTGAAAGRLPASSRRGGAVLLGVLAVAVIVAVILIVSDGSSKQTGGAATTHSSTANATGPKEEGRIALHAPSGSGSKGTVEILSEAGKRAFYIQAEHLPTTSGFFYAVWLYNSPTSALPLSKSPPVGSSHRLAGAALLPSSASQYREILLTRETSTRPKHPGSVVLRGTLSTTG